MGRAAAQPRSIVCLSLPAGLQRTERLDDLLRQACYGASQLALGLRLDPEHKEERSGSLGRVAEKLIKLGVQFFTLDD